MDHYLSYKELYSCWLFSGLLDAGGLLVGLHSIVWEKNPPKIETMFSEINIIIWIKLNVRPSSHRIKTPDGSRSKHWIKMISVP